MIWVWSTPGEDSSGGEVGGAWSGTCGEVGGSVILVGGAGGGGGGGGCCPGGGCWPYWTPEGTGAACGGPTNSKIGLWTIPFSIHAYS
jgi:hypothetical protein